MKTKMLELDNMLFGIQGSLDGIADAIYNQNAIRSRELKAQLFNVGIARQKLKDMAAHPTTSASTPLECVHGELLDGLCNGCADKYGRDYRLVKV